MSNNLSPSITINDIDKKDNINKKDNNNKLFRETISLLDKLSNDLSELSKQNKTNSILLNNLENKLELAVLDLKILINEKSEIRNKIVEYQNNYLKEFIKAELLNNSKSIIEINKDISLLNSKISELEFDKRIFIKEEKLKENKKFKFFRRK